MGMRMARLEALNAGVRNTNSGGNDHSDLARRGDSVSGGMELFVFSGTLLEAVNRLSSATGMDRSAVICEAIMVLEDKLKSGAAK